MSSQPDIIIDDVWSRTEPKYRTRAVLLLMANMVLFGALSCFMYWLRTGWYFPPSHDGYTRVFMNTLNATGEAQVTLYDLFMKPISLQLVPMQAVVIGLLIASLVSIPVLVAILYRFASSVPFCLMVSFLAVMPWLGATLLLSCVIATYSRVKLKFRFAAALLALAPIGVYFFTASSGYVDPQDVLTPQIERGLVVAPLLLSALASCALTAVVLTIARVVDYRPGAIAPLLALMFLTPWFLFITKVGRDELHYRFLEQNYGPPSSEYFAQADANVAIRQVARRLWAKQGSSGPNIEIWQEKVQEFFALQLDPIEARDIVHRLEEQALDRMKYFARDQYRVATECDKFLSDFPSSRYVPSVLYIKGRAIGMRVDLKEFRRSGVLRFYDEFPSEASRTTWAALLETSPDSPLANVARLRLATLDARAGQIDQAIEILNDIREFRPRREHTSKADPEHPSLEKMLAKKPAEASLEMEYIESPAQAEQLRSLLTRNREPVNGDAPLVAFLKCDPRHPHYFQNLQDIIDRYPNSKIRVYIELQLALVLPSPEMRIRELQRIRERYPNSLAMPNILYELGLACLVQGDEAEATKYFDELTEEFHTTTFASKVRRFMRLGSLSSRERSGG